jgi:hypothetical protein
LRKNVGIKPYIIEIMVKGLSEKESLSYLKDNGFEISDYQLYRLKKKIKESRFDRLNLIAKQGFVDQHLERIDKLELINKESDKDYLILGDANGGLLS